MGYYGRKRSLGKTASEIDHEEDKTLEETLSDSDDLPSSNEGCTNAAGKTSSHCEQESSVTSETTTAPRTNWVMNGVITVVVIAAAILLRYLKFKMRNKINKA